MPSSGRPSTRSSHDSCPADRLAAANALMQGTAQLVGTVGPAVAGIAIAMVGVAAAFAVDAVSFAVAAVALWSVRGGATAGRPETASEPAPTPTVDHPAIDPSPDAVTEAVSFGAPATEAPRPSVIASLREGITGRPGRSAHALDRRRLDHGEPGVQRADQRGIAMAGDHPLRRRSRRDSACSWRPSVPGRSSASWSRAQRPVRLVSGPSSLVIVFVMAVVLAALGLVADHPGRRARRWSGSA